MDKYKKYKKVFGESIAKTIREYMPIMYDDLSYTIDYIKKYIPVKKDAVYIISSIGGQIDNIYKDRKVNKEKKALLSNNKIPSPGELLSGVGYTFNLVETEEQARAFSKYYTDGNILCTFKDLEGRLKNNFIIFIVKQDAEETLPANKLKLSSMSNSWKEYLDSVGKFKDGVYDLKGLKNMREDAFGLSVLCIQINKKTGYVKIISRYNHTIEKGNTNPDCTFNSNLDLIINNFKVSLFKYIGLLGKIDKLVNETSVNLPSDIVKDYEGRYFKFYKEKEGVYYGEHSVVCPDENFYWIVDYSKERLVEGYIISNSSKSGLVSKALPTRIRYISPRSMGGKYKIEFLGKDKIVFRSIKDEIVLHTRGGVISRIDGLSEDKKWYIMENYFGFTKDQPNCDNILRAESSYIHLIHCFFPESLDFLISEGGYMVSSFIFKVDDVVHNLFMAGNVIQGGSFEISTVTPKLDSKYYEIGSGMFLLMLDIL